MRCARQGRARVPEHRRDDGQRRSHADRCGHVASGRRRFAAQHLPAGKGTAGYLRVRDRSRAGRARLVNNK